MLSEFTGGICYLVILTGKRYQQEPVNGALQVIAWSSSNRARSECNTSFFSVILTLNQKN